MFIHKKLIHKHSGKQRNKLNNINQNYKIQSIIKNKIKLLQTVLL